jgi:undecaprenyl diphosphate synthase
MFRARLKKGPVPLHVAIIMDGNGRWARRRGLARIEGHRRGLLRIKEVIRSATEFGVKYLTLFAFSTENWKRSKDEVDFLMKACEKFIADELGMLIKKDVSLRHVGRSRDLPESLQASLANACALTKNNKKLFLQLAFNYGSRAEIIDAVKKIAADVKAGRLPVENIDENLMSRCLATAGVPDPDLLIRTSDEMRLSNFLLWQLCYTELYVDEKCWPDFDRRRFVKALREFQKRSRRFGGVND